MVQPYPVAQPDKIDPAAEADVEWLKQFILGVRQIRGELDIPPGKPLTVLVQHAGNDDCERLQRLERSITFLARVEPPRVLADGEAAPQSAAALLGSMQILVPMAGLIDRDAELQRLAKVIAKVDGDLQKNLARLASDKFVNGAPAEVVQKERDRVAQQQAELETLRQQQARVESL